MIGKWIKIISRTSPMWYDSPFYIGKTFLIINEVCPERWLCETPGETTSPCAVWKKDCIISEHPPKDSDIPYAEIIKLTETNTRPSISIEYSIFPVRGKN